MTVLDFRAWLGHTSLKLLVAFAISIMLTATIGRPVVAQQPEPMLTLGFQETIEAGELMGFAAYLHDPAGNPIYDAEIEFSLEAEFLNVSGELEIGTATTDEKGLALVTYAPRISGLNMVTARYAGSEVFAQAATSAELEVISGGQIYRELPPYRIPGANMWLTTGLITTVWIIFILSLGLIGWVNFRTRKEREGTNV